MLGCCVSHCDFSVAWILIAEEKSACQMFSSYGTPAESTEIVPFPVEGKFNVFCVTFRS